jgi:hypothetical protein
MPVFDAKNLQDLNGRLERLLRSVFPEQTIGNFVHRARDGVEDGAVRAYSMWNRIGSVPGRGGGHDRIRLSSRKLLLNPVDFVRSEIRNFKVETQSRTARCSDAVSLTRVWECVFVG